MDPGGGHARLTQTEFQQSLDHPIPRIDIVDVGAMSEGQDRYHELVASGLARVTGFEPDPQEFARLQERPASAYRYLPLFLGSGGPATFHATRYPGCASLFEPDPRVIDLFTTIGCSTPDGNFYVERSEAVNTTRLDELGPEVAVDYLKIDIQGGELDVLRHGTGKLAQTLVIESEVEFIPLYKDQPLFGDVQCFLRDQGFVLHKLIDVAGRPFAPFMPPNPFVPISQILWADAVFVRDFSRLERYTDQGLLKAAAILDVVYRSYDLTALLLGEYDRRQQADLRARYVRGLSGRALSTQCLNIKERP